MSEIIDTYTLVYGATSGRKDTTQGAYFETDQALGVIPTKYITLARADGKAVNKLEITEVRCYMDVTNAVTYQLYLHEDAAATTGLEVLKDTVFASGASKADNTEYIFPSGAGKLPISVDLTTDNRIYYSLDYSGAPGATTGFVSVRGRMLT